jgi:hypothetical protein
MKLTEKILRAPLPDQLKALLEKFDAEFDTRDLRKLGELSGDRSFTRYERYVLNRTYRKARAEVDRVRALDAAMNIVLNRREEMEESFGLQNIANNKAAQYVQAQGSRMHP